MFHPQDPGFQDATFFQVYLKLVTFFFKFRTASLLLFAVLLKTSDHRDSNGLIVQSHLNQALYGHSFLNISGITQKECLERCLANCFCLSFQVYGDTNAGSCQLCSSNKHLKPQAMREFKGCTSFNFGNLYEVN